MAIRDQVRSLQAGRTYYAAREQKRAPFIWPDFRAGRPEWQVVDYSAYVEEGFSINALVYAAIMYKARALWQVPLKAYKGDPAHPDPLPLGHELSRVIQRPNPYQSFPEMQALNTVYLNLAGNVYVYFDRPTADAIPEAFYSLRPDRVFVIPAKDKATSGLMGYLYVPEGRSQWRKLTSLQRSRAIEDGDAWAILPSDMMHVKLPNPGDPLEGMGYGMPPLSAGGRSVDVDNKITEFLKMFMDHGAMFQGLLSSDQLLDPPVIARIRERWKELYGGYQTWDEVAILEQGLKYQRLNPTFDEMGFSEMDGRSETRVLGPFGVPPILIGTRIGLERSTYSNYIEARRACWQDVLIPESRLFEVEWQYYLSRDSGEFVAYDYSRVPAVREVITELIQSWATLVDRGVPKDIATETLGIPLPPLPDGQVMYMPMNMLPVGSDQGADATGQGAATAEEEDRKLWGELWPGIRVREQR